MTVLRAWKTEVGLVAVVKRMDHLPWKHPCGYVAVPEDNPYFGLDYDHERLWDIEVHGGLTYAGPTLNNFEQPGNVPMWWLGFDCGHADDVDFVHGADRLEGACNRLEGACNKPPEYAMAQCELLAMQLQQ